MASHSSTSNSELGQYERVRLGRAPVAFLAFLCCVVLVEYSAQRHHVWIADLASWQWEAKRALIDAGKLDGDVAILGTSVLFHGLDPTAANNAKGGGKVVNLALNGMLLQHQAQLLRERLSARHPPSTVVLEFRHVTVERKSWISGPYFQWWASFADFSESRFFFWNPSLALTFATTRILPTFRFRQAIDNWLFASGRALAPVEVTRDRNRETSAYMGEHSGMVTAVFEDLTLAEHSGPPHFRPWDVDAAGELWLWRLLDIAAEHNTRVVLLLPPAPPYLIESSGPHGFRATFESYVTRVRQRYPHLDLEVFEPGGYELTDFADEIHLSARGRVKLSNDFASWLSQYRMRRKVLFADQSSNDVWHAGTHVD